MTLDSLDTRAASVFDGYLVRKDLVRRYARQYPVPTYAVEFLLGRYCASTSEEEIAEGIDIVEKQLRDRTVRTGEEELFKARAKERGCVKLIDIVKTRLDARNDCFLAELPSLALRDVYIADTLVHQHERMLTDGFYAEVTLAYDGIAALEKGGHPFSVESLRPIQMSKSDALDVLAKGRSSFSTGEWVDFLLRSIGLEPLGFTERAKQVALLRMVPFVERNYNMVELGPRGTGKSHLFQQISPYAHLISGGKATVAKMFVNNATGQRGLVCQFDVVCFDEVSGISFDQKDGVNMMKGYMASGQFSRGKESIRAQGGIVMVGNLDVDLEEQQRTAHLLSPLPSEMRNDTAFMDRLHAFAPGWDFPKLHPGEHFTDHFGLVSDFLSECWSKLRSANRVSVMQGRVHLGGALSGRDIEAVNKTVSGLTKLLFPDPEATVPNEDLEWIVRMALESRRRVKEQQKRCFLSEFRNTHFSYTMGPDGFEQYVSTPEQQSEGVIDGDPLPPGQVWAVSATSSGFDAGLCRIEVVCGPGAGVKVHDRENSPAFCASVKVGEQGMYTRAREVLGNRDPLRHELSVQVRAFDGGSPGAGLGVPVLVAMCGALLSRNTRGGTIVVGSLDGCGATETVSQALRIAELALEKRAQTLLMPVSSRRQLDELPDEVWTKLGIEFYRDAVDVVMKSLVG